MKKAMVQRDCAPGASRIPIARTRDSLDYPRGQTLGEVLQRVMGSIDPVSPRPVSYEPRGTR